MVLRDLFFCPVKLFNYAMSRNTMELWVDGT